MISENFVSEAAAKLEALKSLVSEDPLHESGRHFVDGSYSNLTSCHHGDTGEFHNKADGEAIALLWNLWRSGAIEITSNVGKMSDGRKFVGKKSDETGLIAKIVMKSIV